MADEAPERIWLKAYDGSYTHPSTTWAETSCGDDCGSDVEYIRQDIADARVADLVSALKLAHNCATLRDDGSCDGCVVSYALARAAGKRGG